MSDKTPTQIAMESVRAEWEAPLKAEIERLETKVNSIRQEWYDACEEVKELERRAENAEFRLGRGQEKIREIRSIADDISLDAGLHGHLEVLLGQIEWAFGTGTREALRDE